MKKLFAICLAMVMMLSMTACSETEPQQTTGGDTTQQTTTAPVSMDMDAIYTQLGQDTQMPDMLKLDDALMLDYCGIRAEDTVQAVVMICADSLRTDEIWLIEAADEQAVQRIKGLADSRLKKKGEESKTYSPEQYAVVQKAELLQQGNYLALLVSPDAEAMAQIFRQAAGI